MPQCRHVECFSEEKTFYGIKIRWKLNTRALLQFTQVSDTQIEQFFHVFRLSRGQRFRFLKFFFWYLNIISLEENMQNLNKISLKLTVFTRHSSKLCSRVEGLLKAIVLYMQIFATFSVYMFMYSLILFMFKKYHYNL